MLPKIIDLQSTIVPYALEPDAPDVKGGRPRGDQESSQSSPSQSPPGRGPLGQFLVRRNVPLDS